VAPAEGWTRAQVAWSLGGCALLGALFALNQKISASPLVPLRIFRSRTVIGGNVVMLTAAFCVFGQGITLTQYAQQILRYSPFQFGLMSAAVPATAVIGSIVCQRIVARAGLRSAAAASMGLMALACLVLTQISPHGTFVRDMLPGMIIFGPGLGAGMVAASIASVAGVSGEDSGVASGINNVSFQIGAALGVAGLTATALAWGGHVLTRSHTAYAVAATKGFQMAFAVAAGVALLGLLAAVTLIGKRGADDHQPESAAPDIA